MTDTKITEAEPVKVSDTAIEIASFDQNVLIFETWVTDILATSPAGSVTYRANTSRCATALAPG